MIEFEGQLLNTVVNCIDLIAANRSESDDDLLATQEKLQYSLRAKENTLRQDLIEVSGKGVHLSELDNWLGDALRLSEIEEKESLLGVILGDLREISISNDDDTLKSSGVILKVINSYSHSVEDDVMSGSEIMSTNLGEDKSLQTIAERFLDNVDESKILFKRNWIEEVFQDITSDTSIEELISILEDYIRGLEKEKQPLELSQSIGGPIINLASRLTRHIKEEYGLQPTRKKQAEFLDSDDDRESDLLTNLLRLRALVRKSQLTNSTYTDMPADLDYDIKSKLDGLRLADASSTLDWGLEIELVDRLDHTDINRLRESIDSYYLDNQDKRRALQALMDLGVPVDEDAGGEISLPRSRGFHRQLEAWKILSDLGVLTDEVNIQINVSGLESTDKYVEDLLLVSLAFASTNDLGSLNFDSDTDVIRGAPAHSRKVLFKAVDKKKNKFDFTPPLGLPILIQGERIEFRGLPNSYITVDQAGEGFRFFGGVLESLAAYSRGEESNWPTVKQNLYTVLSPVAMDISDSVYVHLPSNFEVHNPLESYLKALVCFAKYKRDENDSNKSNQERLETKQELLNVARRDLYFLNYFLKRDATMSFLDDDDLLMRKIDRFYAENSLIHGFRSTTTLVQNFGIINGRLSVEGASSSKFRDEVHEILSNA